MTYGLGLHNLKQLLIKRCKTKISSELHCLASQIRIMIKLSSNMLALSLCYICLSAFTSVCLSLSVCLSTCLSFSLTYHLHYDCHQTGRQNVSLSFCLSVYLSFCPSFSLTIYIMIVIKQVGKMSIIKNIFFQRSQSLNDDNRTTKNQPFFQWFPTSDPVSLILPEYSTRAPQKFKLKNI